MDEHEKRTGVKLNAISLSQQIRDQGGTISHATVYAILNGNTTNPSLKTLAELAAFLRCNITDIVPEPDPHHRPLPSEHRTIPDKLAYLTEMRLRIIPAEEHTLDDVAAILASKYKVKVTAEDLSTLWTDPAANPTKDLLEALAAYFGVSAGYLLDDGEGTARVEAQLAELADLAELRRIAGNAGVRSVAARLGNLPPAVLTAVITMVDAIDNKEPS